jgi:hypothetical protein
MNRLPPSAYQTFGISAPLATHHRQVPCEDADCRAREHGWRTLIDEGSDFGRRQAAYIRGDARRRFVESRMPDGLTLFAFESGQRCFGVHWKSLDAEPHYYVRVGDRRGDPAGAGRGRTHRRVEHWLEEFAGNQDRLKTIRERG